MDDMIYRHNSIAEENIDPHGRPAKNAFGEWSEEISSRTSLGYKNTKKMSEKLRQRRIKQMEEIVKKDLE